MAQDFHDKAFDGETRDKLSIYSAYLDKWVPVFAHDPPPRKHVNIFDFFAGVGKDIDGREGSALIALNALKKHAATFSEHQISVRLLLNDRDSSVIDRLTANLSTEAIPPAIEVEIQQKEFEDAFDQYLAEMGGAANLIFLDQFGIKFVTPDLIRKISSIPRTDIIFFVASSIVGRMTSQEEIRKYIDLNVTEVEAERQKIHRLVCQYFLSQLPEDSNYYLAPFSIKRGPNINGLIFGSGHLVGLDKFLGTCWAQFSGDANFDIDGEVQTDLFRPNITKVELFESTLYDEVTGGNLRTDFEVWRYTLESGFVGSHARPVITRLKDDGIIERGDLRISKQSREAPRPIRLK